MGTRNTVARIGMDVHRNFSAVTARDAEQHVLWRARLPHRDRDALRRQLAGWPAGTPVVLEGSFGWGWLADELARAGLAPRLASSRKVAQWRELHGLAKSNRTDADLLSLVAFEPPRLWEVWLPPPEVRQQRELLRHRTALVRMQTLVKNRVHALLHNHGLFPEVASLFGCSGRRWLQRLVGSPDVELPDTTREVLQGELQMLDHLRRQIARATRAFRRQVQAHPAARRLTTLPGVKWVLAYTLLAEIGQIERFATAAKLASYSLLAPRANDTGDDPKQRGRHVGRAGRQTLQWAYIEAAHSAVRKSPRLRAWFDAYTHGGQENANRGYIGVAHRLCHISYAIWKQEVDYREDPPPRPGSRRWRRAQARSVKGQPVAALVPVATC